MDENIIDLIDKNETFREVNEILEKLNFGFDALAMDYGFHVESTFGGNHTIFELRDNVKYRLFSSIFHLRILLQQLYTIEEEVKENYIKSRQQSINHFSPNPFIFRSYEKEVSSIFDSIVFHLSSIYDYMSLLINYVCGKSREERLIWTQLAKSVRDKKNPLSVRKIAVIIDTIDRQFVSALYDHRSDLIHRESDLNNFKYSIDLMSAQTNIQFLCTRKITKRFKKTIDADKNYTTSYFSYILIKNTVETIARLLYGLKLELEQNSAFSKNIRSSSSKLLLIVVDPITREAQSPSIMYWPSFLEFFKFDK